MAKIRDNAAYDFLITEDPQARDVFLDLNRRVHMAHARKASASQPMKVMDQAQMALSLMLSTSMEQLPRMGLGDVAEEMSRIMPRTTAEVMPVQSYETTADTAADALAIEQALANTTNEESAEADLAQSKYKPLSTGAPTPTPASSPDPEVDSAWAGVAAETEPPEAEIAPDLEGGSMAPFGRTPPRE